MSGALVARLNIWMLVIPSCAHTNTIVVHKSTGKVLVEISIKSVSRMIPVGACVVVAML